MIYQAFAGCLLLTLLTAGAIAQTKSLSALEQLKALAGEWEGKASDGSSRQVKYEIVSGGSAVLETLQESAQSSMLTVYHLDGKKLLATHYCSAGNQPRLLANLPAGPVKTLKFAFLDVTNLAAPAAGHMRQLTIHLLDADYFTQEWTYQENGKALAETFQWQRKK
jgi:hypothetical protein